MKSFLILKAIPRQRLQYFSKFLSSPYHNKRETVVRYFEMIKGYYPNFDHPNIADEKVFAKLFKGEKYSKNKLHKVRTSLLTLVKEFLVIDAIKTNELLRQRFLLHDYLNSEIDYILPKDYDNITKEVEQATTKNLDGFLEKFQFQLLNYYKPKSEINGFSSNNHYDNLVKGLKQNSLFAKLILVVEGLNIYRVNGIEPQLEFTDEELREIETIFPKEHPKVALYLKLFFLLKIEQPNLQLYIEAKEYFEEKLDHFSNNEIKSLASIFINYTVLSIRLLDDDDFKEQQWNMYQLGISYQFLMDEHYIHPIHFFNIVSLGSELKKWELTEKFIRDNRKYLKEDIKKDILGLCRATYSFKRNKFWKVIDELDKVKFEEWLFKLRTISLRLRTYFEMRILNKLSSKFFESELMEFKKFIENEVPLKRQTEYLSYVKWLFLLNRILSNERISTSEFEKLLLRLEDEEKLVTKKWIRMKMLENKSKIVKKRA